MPPKDDVVPVLIIGAGPAGLMAAEQLANAGVPVCMLDSMPSVGRKFLRAGVGGLNLTHDENTNDFIARYSDPVRLSAWLSKFDASALRQWTRELGIETFVGSSGRVFPVGLKAAPLLRAWLQRLKRQGVEIKTRMRWLGFESATLNSRVPGPSTLIFESSAGQQKITAEVVVFALGGGSWARLGSDGIWMSPLQAAGITCVPFKPANCGFDYPWSKELLMRYAGVPLKTVRLTVQSQSGVVFSRKGEVLVSRNGLQGSLVYAASRTIRQQIEENGAAQLYWDLLPDQTLEQLTKALYSSRGKDSISNWLRKRVGLKGLGLSLFYELRGAGTGSAEEVACQIKRLPQMLHRARPLDEAISTAGGVSLQQLDERLMSVTRPGLFFAGEMLDWEAPTGGYLLNACFASGRIAGQGALAYLQESRKQ